MISCHSSSCSRSHKEARPSLSGPTQTKLTSPHSILTTSEKLNKLKKTNSSSDVHKQSEVTGQSAAQNGRDSQALQRAACWKSSFHGSQGRGAEPWTAADELLESVWMTLKTNNCGGGVGTQSLWAAGKVPFSEFYLLGLYQVPTISIREKSLYASRRGRGDTGSIL